MLTIRFARTGKKNRAQFQIVLQEHTIAPGGRHVEVLGSYDPHQKKAALKEERIKYWVSQGVQVSDSAFNLLLSKGLVAGDKRKIKMPTKKAEEAPVEADSTDSASSQQAAAPAETKAEETPAAEATNNEAKPEEEAAPKEGTKVE